MRPRIDFDVVICGGGVAGMTAAAALAEFGWSVLIVEPGQHADRRLAGELIHPTGVAGLMELGLYDTEAFARAVPIHGFAVFDQASDDCGIRLPYADRHGSCQSAVALEHGSIRNSLETTVERFDYVRLWRDARVVGLDLGDRAAPRVSIARQGAVETVACRMIVAADGAASPVRGFAGIGHVRRRVSTITGYVVGCDNLPAPGYGHVFIGAAAPLLVYEIGAGQTRVLFDQPIGQSSEPAAQHRARMLAALPASLRAEVAASIAVQRGLSFASFDVLVSAVTRGPLVLVGDAGGSCHPLTATGMTVGIGDALRLRDALRQSGGDIMRGLALYSRRRRAPQRARLLLASALYETCSQQAPELRLVRDGLIGYWGHDARGREASMALLAMTDTSVLSILRQMVGVGLFGLSDRRRRGADHFARWLNATRLMAALSTLVIRHMTMTMQARRAMAS